MKKEDKDTVKSVIGTIQNANKSSIIINKMNS